MPVWTMFSGPPLPLADTFPLFQLIAHAEELSRVGAWVRGRSLTQCSLTRAGRCCRVLISGDLGTLLRDCRHIVVREGSRAVVLDAELVIQWRTLQVVTATPYLPGFEELKARFPSLRLDPGGLSVPIGGWSPEAVLAECLAQGVQVVASRIVYEASPTLPAELGRPPPAAGARQ